MAILGQMIRSKKFWYAIVAILVQLLSDNFNLDPVDCLWSGFGSWSRCSVTYGEGKQQRKRKILQQAVNGGQRCQGQGIDTRTCTEQACSGKNQQKQ